MTTDAAQNPWPNAVPDGNWFPVALSASLDAETSTGIRLSSNEIALWRDETGDIHAWEDRCPHRGMKLSLGFVRGDHIACLYHGWQYDRAGQCRYIPAHPSLDVPKTIAVPVFACFEWAGLIWVCPSVSAGSVSHPALPSPSVLPLRSLYLDVAEDHVPALLRARLPDILGRAADSDTVLKALSSCLLAVEHDGLRLLVAIQSAGESRSALHMVLIQDPQRDAGAAQAKLLLARLPGLRHAALAAHASGAGNRARTPVVGQVL
jgi:nitrite reductase/ring-hydroxylating ferredoxin subunit